MSWHVPAIIALVLLALALVVAKVAAGSIAFEGRSVLIFLALAAAARVAVAMPVRRS